MPSNDTSTLLWIDLAGNQIHLGTHLCLPCPIMHAQTVRSQALTNASYHHA